MTERTPWFERSFDAGPPPSMLPNLIERLRGTPVRISDRLAELPPEVLTRQDNNTWSIQENVGHLWDLEELWAKRLADFLSDRGTRLTANGVRYVFVQLSRQIGLRGPSDSHGPRLHDLRHRFAVHTMLRWYRAGVDVERHLPQLSTYLGHTHVSDTYWYLSATPELLRLAAGRLDNETGGSA